MQIELSSEKKIYGFDQQLKDELPKDKDLSVKFPEPINIKGTLEILNDELGMLKFHLTGDVIYPCSRCLEDIVTPIDYDFEEQVELVDDQVFNVDDYIHDCFYINEPSQIICKEDCLGLCPICGNNLNKHTCDCESIIEEESIDPRLAKLKQLL